MKDFTSRNKLIYAKHRWGLTVRELAKIHHISPARIGQIIKTFRKRQQIHRNWGDLPLLFIAFLEKGGIHSIKEFKQTSENDLLKIKGIGLRRLELIKQKIK